MTPKSTRPHAPGSQVGLLPRTVASGVLVATIGMSIYSGTTARSVSRLEGVVSQMDDINIKATGGDYSIVSVSGAPHQQLLLRDLGWTEEQIELAHYRYLPWADDWDTPEMAAYDAL